MPGLTGLFVPILIILTFGLSTTWSTVPNLFVSQSAFVLISTLVVFLLRKIDARLIQSVAWMAYPLTIILLLTTFVFGEVTRGSTRWIPVGTYNLQTSEIAKPLLLLSYAYFFTHIKKASGWKGDLTWLGLQAFLGALPTLIVFSQPDLGSAIILGVGWLGVLLSYGLTKTQIGAMVFGIVGFIPIAFFNLKPYQYQRLVSFINPFADPTRSGYNVIQSMIAVGSGKVFGKGVRMGTQSHLRFLPERHTDFAFASFAEEFGFLGVSLLLLSICALLIWLTRTAKHLNEFSRLYISGVFFMIFFQAIINIGMNLGLMPVTGITLPFVSYGGSSLLSLGLLLGFVLSLRQTPTHREPLI
jgi:rod shape determining protein RodA